MSFDLEHRVILMKACASVLFAGRRAVSAKKTMPRAIISMCGCRNWRPARHSCRGRSRSRLIQNAGPPTSGGIGERCVSRRLKRLIALLAALSSQTNFSVGCYCEDETRCHRSLLKELLFEQGAEGV